MQRSHILLPGLYFCVLDRIFQCTVVFVMLWSHMCWERVVLLRLLSDLNDWVWPLKRVLNGPSVLPMYSLLFMVAW